MIFSRVGLCQAPGCSSSGAIPEMLRASRGRREAEQFGLFVKQRQGDYRST